MTVISESISSLLVIVPPTHAAGIDLYQSFTGSHARMHSLNCNINGLLGSAPYTVRQINSAAVMVEVEEDPTIKQYRITRGAQIGPMGKCALHFLNIISSLCLIFVS